MKVLGLTVLTHDTAACIVEDDKVLVAIEEERLTGVKHSKEFPNRSIAYYLDALEISAEQIDQVAICLDTSLMLQNRYLANNQLHQMNEESVSRLLTDISGLRE